jgi:hypothetical protein
MAEYHGSETYKPGWGDPVDVQRWVIEELAVGETLVFPKGEAVIGDVTADIDKSLDPDVVADLKNPLSEFDEQSFDTVYCDPPYSFYSDPHSEWLHPLWSIARERLILQTPRQRVQIPHSEKEWRIAEPRPGSPQTNVWLFQVFKRTNLSLDGY